MKAIIALTLLALFAMASATVLINGGATYGYPYTYPYVGSRLGYGGYGGLHSAYYGNSYYYPGYRYSYVPSVPLAYDWFKK